MAFNEIIARDAEHDPLIPEPVSAEVIKEMPKSSAMLQLARRVPMSTKTSRQPVLSVLPTAYWVGGDTGLKQTTRQDWENVVLIAEELATIVPIPEAYLADSQVPIWDEVRPAVAEALGRALDLACLFGINKPKEWPTDLYSGAFEAGNTHIPGADLGQSIAYLSRDIAKDGFNVNGFAAAPGFSWELTGYRNAQGNPIYIPTYEDMFAGRLYGRRMSEIDNGGWQPGIASLIAGDWSKAIIGTRQDITFRVFTEGVISDEDGRVILNLMQQDAVALRVVARFGYAVAQPGYPAERRRRHPVPVRRDVPGREPLLLMTPPTRTPTQARPGGRRVLAMLHAYPPHHNAGAEWMLHTMLRALVERGHAVEVLLNHHHDLGEPYEIHGVTVHPKRGKGDPFEWLRDVDRRPDVIVTHLENTPRATLLGNRFGVPVVQVLHNEHPFNLAWCDRAALVVVNAQWIADATGLPNPTIVRPPVLPADYATTPGECVTLVNLSPDKGAHIFYQLAQRFPDRRFLGVRGGYGEQIIRTDLPNVEILDTVPGDQMRDQVYARTRVLLAPSVYESYGRVGVEAMCSGIPVIAHPTPGLRESLGDAGIFAYRDDPDAWIAALAKISTVRGWKAASRRAARRAADLDPTADLNRWCEAIAALGHRRSLERIGSPPSRTR